MPSNFYKVYFTLECKLQKSYTSFFKNEKDAIDYMFNIEKNIGFTGHMAILQK